MSVIVRDHRSTPAPVVRDHRTDATEQTPVVRDHRTDATQLTPDVRDHRTPPTQPTDVRDHRTHGHHHHGFRPTGNRSEFERNPAVRMPFSSQGGVMVSPTNALLSSQQGQQGCPVPGVQLPPLSQRFSQVGGIAGEYGNTQLAVQMQQGTESSSAIAATMGAGFMPTGDSSLDLANSIANAPTYSPDEQALLNSITDPQQRAMQELQMQQQKQALLSTTVSNIANMRHETMKSVASNLRG